MDQLRAQHSVTNMGELSFTSSMEWIYTGREFQVMVDRTEKEKAYEEKLVKMSALDCFRQFADSYYAVVPVNVKQKMQTMAIILCRCNKESRRESGDIAAHYSAAEV